MWLPIRCSEGHIREFANTQLEFFIVYLVYIGTDVRTLDLSIREEFLLGSSKLSYGIFRALDDSLLKPGSPGV